MRVNRVRALVAVFLASFLIAPAAVFAAGQPDGGGFVWLDPPPASVAVGARESDTQMHVFAERINFVLPTAVTVDFTQPGTYDQPTDLQPTAIAAGTVVNSYYVHADQAGAAGGQRITATITFPDPIVGVILTGGRLDASRLVLGVPTTTYAAGSGYELEGACPPASGQDCAILDPNGRTLTLHVTNYNVNDDVRVLTQGAPLYAICPLYDQTKSHRLGSTVPIRLQLCDANGNNLSSASIIVKATDLKKTDNIASPVEDSGSANSPDDDFRYDAALGGYIYNLSTKALSSGTWTLSFTVNGVSQSAYKVSFDIK